MTNFYTLSERERQNIILRAEYERRKPRHQETLAKLRILAAII
ncbi:hypothetical protein [Porphyromonas pogonae]|nr:hypothetical protein [Porphyromonas pogonae]